MSNVQFAAATEFPDTYLHAKFVLVRTPKRSVTLTGSANLSLAALWSTDQPGGGRPAGNIELVTLAEGPTEHFDELPNGLDLRVPAEEVANLNVTYLGDQETTSPGIRPRLLRGTWAETTLTLVAAGDLPGGELSLILAGTVTPGAVIRDGTTYIVTPPADAAAALDSRAVPVWLRIAADDGDVDTTPVYPYHPSSLATLLMDRRDPDLLGKSGNLDMEPSDEALGELLDELDAALVIDRTSLWRLARRSPPPDIGGDGNAPSTGHGRTWTSTPSVATPVAQYETATRRTDRLEATDLQVVLSAITDHFRAFGDVDEADQSAVASQVERSYDVDLDDTTVTLRADNADLPTDETTEQYEAETEGDGERERRRLKIETRNRLAWQRFAERFTKALRDQDFLDLVGPRVALANAVILNHLLALLVARGVVAPDKGIGYQIELWAFLYGDATSDGYVSTLSEEDQWAAMELFEERGSAVTILCAVDLAVQLTKQHALDSCASGFAAGGADPCGAVPRLRPRTCCDGPPPDIRPPTSRAASLVEFAEESTRREVDEALAGSLGIARSQFIVREETVKRGDSGGRRSLRYRRPSRRAHSRTGLALFRAAVAAHPAIEYVRIKHLLSGVVATWDRQFHDCWRYDPTEDEPSDLAEPTNVDPAWLTAADALADVTERVQHDAA